MKKNVILFGGDSFIGQAFIKEYDSFYNILPVFKNNEKGLSFDFLNTEYISDFIKKVNVPIEVILFLQGMNPSKGIKEITEEHFTDMLKVNLITPTLLIRELLTKIIPGASIMFVSSIAKRKGSYDPSYSTAKAGITGLVNSLANAYSQFRFNSISLGLVENSPVYNSMTEDYRIKHAEKMFNNSFIQISNVTSVINLLITNSNINRADFPIDGGYI